MNVKTVGQSLKRLAGWPAKYLFGDDIFISYSRADGVTYAEGLAGKLTERKLTCRFDVWGTEPGREMPAALKRALARSATLVLVGTPGAAASGHVADEVERMKKLGRRIVPVVFDGVLLKNGLVGGGQGRELPGERETSAGPGPSPLPAEALWAGVIEGLPVTWEEGGKLKSGEPSEEVLNRVEKTFTFKRKDDRLRFATKIVGAVLVVFLLGIVAAAYGLYRQVALAAAKTEEAQQKNREAVAAGWLASALGLRAEEQAVSASAATLLAAQAERVAGEKTKLADEATLRADEQSRRADEQTQRAETARRRAAEQELSAHKNLARSFYAQAQADAANDPLRALAWADSAVREAPAGDENLSAYLLREVNLASGAPLAVVNTPAGVETASVSPDGGTVVTVTETGRFSVWDARTGAPLPHPLPDPNAESVSVQDEGQTPAFSPDGQRVALTVWTAETPGEALEPHLLIWEARTGQTVRDISLEGWGSEDDADSHSALFEEEKVPTSTTFSPDGAEFIIFNGDDQGMHVWDVASGEPIEYEQPADERDVGDSTPAGGPRVSRDPARNWFFEVITDESRASAKNEYGAEVATDILRVRDIKTGREIKTGAGAGELILLDKGHPSPEHIRFADFTRDARKVVVTTYTSERTLLRVWDLVSGRVSQPVVLGGQEDEAGDKGRDAGGSGGAGGVDRLHIEDARSISPDGKSLLLVRQDGEKAVGVELWDISGDEPKFSSFHAYDQRKNYEFGTEGGRTKAPEISIYADDGEHVIDISPEFEEGGVKGRREVTVWNLRSGLLLSRPLLVADGGKLFHVSTRDKTASVAYKDGTVLTWALARDGSLDAEKRKAVPAGVGAVFPVPGWGSALTLGSKLELRDAETWDVKWGADVRFTSIVPPKFNDKGQRFTVVDNLNPLLGNKDASLKVRRLSDGALEPGFRPIPADRDMAVEFSRDGDALVTKTRGSPNGVAVRRWSAATGEQLPGPSVELLYKDAMFLGFTRYAEFCMTLPQFSFPGVGSANYTEITLRRVDQELTPVARLRFADHATAALAAALFRSAKAIRPAGPDAVVATLDSGVEVSATAAPSGAVLMNEGTKRRLVPPVESGADLSKLVLSPDGRLVAAPFKSNGATFARVWDAATGLPLSDRLWHEGDVESLAFSPDGRRLMTATGHGTLRAWFAGDFGGRVPQWAARMGEALGGQRVVKGLDAQRLPAEEHARSRREFESALARSAAAGDEAARFLLGGLKR